MANMKNIHDHHDLIKMTYTKSQNHRWMSNEERAAQFAPFAALSGHKEVIAEMEKTSQQQRQLSEDQIKQIDQTLHMIAHQLAVKPLIALTFFEKNTDGKNGQYHSVIARAVKIDMYQQMLVLEDTKKIYFADIDEIEIVK